jgi:transcriptional regulator with XRE-family HTH domain
MGRPRTRTTSPGVIGENVTRLRVSQGLSQAELAKRSGLSRSTIATLELGRYSSPDLGTLDAVARALSVSVEALRAPHLERMPLHPAVAAFRASPWMAAMRPSDAELVWLESLPELVWVGRPPTAETVARILQWHRGS